VTYSFFSPDPKVTAVDIGDYINSNLVDIIGRIEGVGDINVFGTPTPCASGWTRPRWRSTG
jgi:HAE1 family hydrophobic/amphiphilic exporter-1